VNEAPDFVEPFEAWRVWRIVRREREYSLGSIVQRTVWPAGRALTADCLRTQRVLTLLRRRRPHGAPDAQCECGIYAAGLEHAGLYLADAPWRGVAPVLGKVALWGTVVECERGFRASHAYPTRIYIPADAGKPWRVGWEEVAFGLTRYRVPLELLASPAVDAAQFLTERQAA
jgi:hypothetical protein